MYGFTLILTLAVVGGVIAYIGDRLGMNVGRKKLTLFGLRPKHTSIVVTIVTGVLIVTASIGVLSIASQDVRTALFKMKEIQQELLGLQSSYSVMKGQRDAAQQELLEAESRVSEALADYNDLIFALEGAEEEVRQQKALIGENEGIISKMVEHLETLQEEATTLQRDIDDLLAGYVQIFTAFGQIREGNIAFNASEVILTTVIEKGLDRAQVRATLERLLKEVDALAYKRSGRNPDSDVYEAIYLRPGVLDLAVEDILLASQDVVVRAVSESNTIPGVPVVVYLENYLNQMVFSKGTVLTAGRWDPKSGVGIDQVILQMLGQGNSAALDMGMAVSEEGATVLLPGDAFLEAISAAGKLQEEVQIELVAAEDTWRANAPMPVFLKITQL